MCKTQTVERLCCRIQNSCAQQASSRRMSSGTTELYLFPMGHGTVPCRQAAFPLAALCIINDTPLRHVTASAVTHRYGGCAAPAYLAKCRHTVHQRATHTAAARTAHRCVAERPTLPGNESR